MRPPNAEGTGVISIWICSLLWLGSAAGAAKADANKDRIAIVVCMIGMLLVLCCGLWYSSAWEDRDLSGRRILLYVNYQARPGDDDDCTEHTYNTGSKSSQLSTPKNLGL